MHKQTVRSEGTSCRPALPHVFTSPRMILHICFPFPPACWLWDWEIRVKERLPPQSSQVSVTEFTHRSRQPTPLDRFTARCVLLCVGLCLPCSLWNLQHWKSAGHMGRHTIKETCRHIARVLPVHEALFISYFNPCREQAPFCS